MAKITFPYRIPISQLPKLPEIGFVYALFKREDVVYIGSSFDPIQCIQNCSDVKLDFDQYSFVAVSSNEMKQKEAEAIHQYRPKYNFYKTYV